MLEAIVSAASNLLDIQVVLTLLLGVTIGMIFGALPGVGGMLAMVIALPFTFGWEPSTAIYFLIGIMGSVTFAGSIPAILLNTPGTGPNVCTCFDGYPMTKKGQGGKALGMSATASALGALFGVFILMLCIPFTRAIVLAFSAPEFFWLVMFGLVSVAFAARGNMIKGLFTAGLGILISLIGYSPAILAMRFTGGSWYLFDGLPLIPVLVGLFAVSEMISYSSKGGTIVKDKVPGKLSGVFDGVKEVFRHKITFFRSAAIGTGIGIIPGIGGVVASFLAYSTAMQSSKHPETYGKGEPEGIIASEAANDAKDGGALIPTLAFGIPGSPMMAILLGAFLLHGIVPGPQLLEKNLDIAWILIFGLVIANILTSTVGLSIASYLAKLATIRVVYITPIVLLLSTSGTYLYRGNIWDVVLMMIAGVLGYTMKKYGFPVICLVMGYLLGILAEKGFQQTLQSSYGDYSVFFTRPISIVLIVLMVILISLPVINVFRSKRRNIS
ncbi:tripartite tricarboxylate transporter permease [Chloroflexota bacterium]